jgi:hypothetical protein
MKTGKFSLAVAALMLVGAGAPTFAQNYTVAAKIVQEGNVVGEPVVALKHGVPALISVAGDGGYELELTVTEQAADEVVVATKLRTHKGSVKSAVTAKPGQPTVVSSGGLDLTFTVTSSSS